MDLRIVEEPVSLETLAAYARVSIAFTVDSQLRVDLIDGGLGGISLTEEPVNSFRYILDSQLAIQ